MKKNKTKAKKTIKKEEKIELISYPIGSSKYVTQEQLDVLENLDLAYIDDEYGKNQDESQWRFDDENEEVIKKVLNKKNMEKTSREKNKISDVFNGVDNIFINIVNETPEENVKEIVKSIGMSIDEVDDLNTVVKESLEFHFIPSKKDIRKIIKVLKGVKKVDVESIFEEIDPDEMTTKNIDELIKDVSDLSA